MPWPQYYQGKGWDSDFSFGWGINSILMQFIVDKNGNLAKTGDIRDADFVPSFERMLKRL